MAHYHRPPPPVTGFPKIAVVCGAHTDLGRRLCRNLLQSDEVEKVIAIAPERVRDFEKFSWSVARKLEPHKADFRNMDKVLSRIREADYAFCITNTDKRAYEAMDRRSFRDMNFEGPSQFIRKMFELGVLHLTILSHVNADSHSKTDFYRMKGELEKHADKLCGEAGEYAPYMSIFKVPTPVARSNGRSKKDLQDKDIVTAMQYNAFSKGVLRKGPACRRKALQFEELYADDVVTLVKDAKQTHWGEL